MNKKHYLIIAGLVACSVAVHAQAPKMIVAIDKFENEANCPDELFQTFRSRITDNIINTRKFEVVERQRLASVLSERKLVDSGLTKEETAPEAGKLKAAGFILYGSVLSLGRDGSSVSLVGLAASKGTIKVELQLRIANAETGKILSSKTIRASKSQSRMAGDGQLVSGNVEEQATQDAIREAAKKVTDALMDLAYPAKIITINDADLLVNLTKEQTEAGAIYEVFAVGKELFDPDTKESLGASESYIGKIEISRTMPKFSSAIPAGGKDLVSFRPGMIIRRQDEEAATRQIKKEKDEAVKSFESRF